MCRRSSRVCQFRSSFRDTSKASLKKGGDCTITFCKLVDADGNDVTLHHKEYQALFKEFMDEASVQAEKQMQAMIGSSKKQDMKAYHAKKGECRELTHEEFKATDTIVFYDCSDCEYTIKDTATKVFMQHCTNCNIKINGKVITHTLELYKGVDNSIFINTKLWTVQVDMCSKTALNFGSKEDFQSVIWAGCNDLRVDVAQSKYKTLVDFDRMLEENTALKRETDQFKIYMNRNSLSCDKVVRLKNGFPTTQKELDEFDRRQEYNMQQLANQWGITINRKKTEKLSPNAPCKCGSGKKQKKCCGLAVMKTVDQVESKLNTIAQKEANNPTLDEPSSDSEKTSDTDLSKKKASD